MIRTLVALCALVCASGCVSRAELNQARLDDLRYTSRVIGYAVDANEGALQTRIALLRAFKGDPRFPLLVEALGTLEANEAQLAGVRKSKLEIVQDGQRVMGSLAGPTE